MVAVLGGLYVIKRNTSITVFGVHRMCIADIGASRLPASELTPGLAHGYGKTCQDKPASIPASKATKYHREEYLDSLVIPSYGELERISNVQQEKEEQIIKQRSSSDEMSEEQAKAAGLIQRNFRGYRERRQMEGKGLDADRRWAEILKEARYLTAIKARPKESPDATNTSLVNGTSSHDGLVPHDNIRPRRSTTAKQNWRKVGTIARRAAGDEDSDIDSDEEDTLSENATPGQREQYHKRREEKIIERRKAAKMMDLQYWLESVDQYHRYGSNLRTYHQEWLKADTHQNFFQWLDEGDGRFIDCAGCPRERLDREKVRYLSREERMDYLVKINKDGLLYWAKNGELIDTTVDYKDSIYGIVPVDDPTPAYVPPAAKASIERQDDGASASDMSASGSSSESSSNRRATKYATPELANAKGINKVRHVSATTIFQTLLRSSVKKNTWIYVADTSFRLYVGIKQSGAFQHSSFLHGSRIYSAGLIKIKHGCLEKLSPLSGHYRPTTASFRNFVRSLKDAGVDMSHVSISRSYAILVVLEAYTSSRRRGRRFVDGLIHGRDSLLRPDELRQRELDAEDRSQSAERERRILDLQHEHDKMRKHEHRHSAHSLLRKLHLGKQPESNDAEQEIPPLSQPNAAQDQVLDTKL